MIVGLASYRFINGDLPFNLAQIAHALAQASGHADMICFGEAFLQGFSAMNWDYAHDRKVAITRDDPLIADLCALTLRYGVDLALGYLERDGEALYSSYTVIEQGAVLHNYRRISQGWKEYWHTDDRYREGDDTPDFCYRGHTFRAALCGDLWEFPERFKTDGVLLWPVCCNFTKEEWQREEEAAYAAQAAIAARHVLFVDGLETGEPGVRAAYDFKDGKVNAGGVMDEDGILYVEV